MQHMQRQIFFPCLPVTVKRVEGAQRRFWRSCLMWNVDESVGNFTWSLFECKIS